MPRVNSIHVIAEEQDGKVRTKCGLVGWRDTHTASEFDKADGGKFEAYRRPQLATCLKCTR